MWSALTTPRRLPARESGHGRRVGELAAAVAKLLGGPQPRLAYLAGCHHDIGKALLPIDPRRLRRRLYPAERAVVERHTLLGGRALVAAGAPGPVVAAALFHHERLDGSGYPFGISGTDVPLLAQIVGAVDLYDALRSPRSYKGPWRHADIVAYGRRHAGRWFRPGVWEAVMAVTGRQAHGERRAAAIGRHDRRPGSVEPPWTEPATSVTSSRQAMDATPVLVR